MSMPTFVNISVNRTIRATLEGDYIGKTAESLLLDFVEAAMDGVKISFSYKESKQAFVVAVTLPNTRVEGELICATFWDGELYDALEEAHQVCFFFQGIEFGFYEAKQKISRYEKELAAVFKRFSQEGDTPITFRLVE